MPDVERIIVGGPWRLLLGLALSAGALALVGLGFHLEWGIGWMAWIPAACLLMPAAALGGRQEIRRVPTGLEVIRGRFFRRIQVVGLAGAELEVLPAGGAWVVVLHRQGSALPLASWLSQRTAERIAALCDRAHPDGAVPRRAMVAPAGDR